jgi:hypothetical protein
VPKRVARGLARRLGERRGPPWDPTEKGLYVDYPRPWRHIYPVIGATAIREVTRGDCRTLITACRDKGLNPKSIENICRTLSSVLTQAVVTYTEAGPTGRLNFKCMAGNFPMVPGKIPLRCREISRRRPGGRSSARRSCLRRCRAAHDRSSTGLPERVPPRYLIRPGRARWR